MPQGTPKSADIEKTRIMLGLLESVQRGGEQSQRRLASELGVALGLVNTYLKRCVTKGLVKVRSAPARRYAYYLTPYGFAEKSRLTLEYLSRSFSLFRQAKNDCTAILVVARERGFLRIAVLGANDLAEIAAICSLDLGVTIAAIVDPQSALSRFVGVPVVKSFDAIDGSVNAVLIADLTATQETIKAAVDRFGANGVLVPEFLGLAVAGQSGVDHE
jgi:DNA-binding MarR family transcriptional regulator